MNIDFGLTAKDYSRYRKGYPSELYERLKKYDVGVKDQSILDLGTGTGYFARGLAKQGANVTGVDISKALLEEAKKLDQESNVNIHYINSEAESLPFSSSKFDVVTAAQCWHWFQSEEVLKEIRRVLKKQGKLVISHLDWIPLDNNIVSQTEELILFYNPAWKGNGGTGVYPDWLTQVASSNFNNIETFTFDLYIKYNQEQWRGRIRASAGVGASLSQDKITKFDNQLKTLLQNKYANVIEIPHRVFCLICNTN